MGIENIGNLTENTSPNEFVVTKSTVPIYPEAFKCNPDESLGMAEETPDEDKDDSSSDNR